uniref:Claudin n=1 Tax=Oryzias latipes TaxID=8090 RepID=A0A3P9J2A2_ORYLA
MQQQLELAALAVGLVGWMCSVLTRCLALWKVSGTVDNSTATLPAYWDGVWLEWDHWDLAQDGSLHCSFYQSLMSLSGSFRTWRALIMAAIGVGGFAAAIGGVGLIWFPKRGQVKVFSGSLFVVSGILLALPTSSPLVAENGCHRNDNSHMLGPIPPCLLIMSGTRDAAEDYGSSTFGSPQRTSRMVN